MRFRGIHPLIPGVMALMLLASCATDKKAVPEVGVGPHAPSIDSTRSVTPRPPAGLDFDSILADSLVIEGFAEYGITDPLNIPSNVPGWMVEQAIYRAEQLVSEAHPESNIAASLTRISELLIWQVLRAQCAHTKYGLPAELGEPEQEDLLEINARFFPGLEDLELPPCDGGAR